MPYTGEDEMMTFDQVRVYPPEAAAAGSAGAAAKKTKESEKKLAIVTYGNGVVTALQARYVQQQFI